MPTAPPPFPWWLWLIAVLWACSIVLWQRGVLPRDWQRGLGVVIVAYTALLVGAATAGMTWSVARGVFWLAGALAVGSSLLFVRETTILGRRLAVWGASCGVAGMLVQLGAELPAGLVLIIGAILVVRMRLIGTDAPTAILHRDAWLIAMTAALVVVAWIGSIRYAITVELERPRPSQHISALPKRDQIQRWLNPEPADDNPQPVQWEWLALTATLVCFVIVTRRQDS